jgi:hypothetical protein
MIELLGYRVGPTRRCDQLISSMNGVQEGKYSKPMTLRQAVQLLRLRMCYVTGREGDLMELTFTCC